MMVPETFAVAAALVQSVLFDLELVERVAGWHSGAEHRRADLD